MIDRKTHWDHVYQSRPPQQVSWYEAHPAVSLALIADSGIARGAPIIDVGGGASTLVDHLLNAGYERITVLDLSGTALEHARQRLGPRAMGVSWIETDLLEFVPAERYALWHDRALFHFLVDTADRDRYVAVLESALAPDGQAILAGFAHDGPKRCSGLDTRSVDVDPFGARFRTLDARCWRHETPWAAQQRFQYLRLGIVLAPASGARP